MSNKVIMLQKTFIRLMLLVFVTFTALFIIFSVTTGEQVTADNTDCNTRNENVQPSGDFVLETLAGSILIGTN